MRYTLAMLAACGMLAFGPALTLADNNPNKGSGAPSIEKKQADRLQAKIDKNIAANGPVQKTQRLEAERDAYLARCGTPCN